MRRPFRVDLPHGGMQTSGSDLGLDCLQRQSGIQCVPQALKRIKPSSQRSVNADTTKAAGSYFCSNSVMRCLVRGVRSAKSASAQSRPSCRHLSHGRPPVHDSFFAPEMCVQRDRLLQRQRARDTYDRTDRPGQLLRACSLSRTTSRATGLPCARRGCICHARKEKSCPHFGSELPERRARAKPITVSFR